MKNLISIVVAMCFGVSLSAAGLDSLRLALTKTKKPIEKVDILNNMGKDFQKAGQNDSLEQFARKALALAEKHDYDKGIAVACNNIAAAHIVRAEYDKAE